MEKKIKICGTVYNVEEGLDFTNVVCEFEKMGVDVIATMQGEGVQQLSLCRAVVAFVTKKSLTEAGKLLTRHLVNGGNPAELANLFYILMEEAGFGKAEEAEKQEAATPQNTESTQEK